MSTDKFGVTEDNGAYYFIDADNEKVNLTYYNPVTGDYAYAGDNNIYNDGNPTGQTVNAAAVLAATATSHSNWLDILNSAVGAAGNIFGHNNTTPTQTAAPYALQAGAPVQPVNNSGMVWKIVGIGAVLTLIIVVVVRNKNKNGSK